MGSGGTGGSRVRRHVALEAVRRERQRVDPSRADVGGRDLRRRRIRARPVERTRRTAQHTACSASQGQLFASPRPGQDVQDLLGAVRDERENAALLDSIHCERIGTLAKLVAYLEENRAIDGPPETFWIRHAIQKQAYLARALGVQVGYEFEFLENGAYSPVLAADLYMLDRADGGTPPPKQGDPAGTDLLRLVQGRGPLTLQAMTFAMRDIQNGAERDEFVGRMDREYMQYSRRLLEWAFDRVFAVVGGGKAQ